LFNWAKGYAPLLFPRSSASADINELGPQNGQLPQFTIERRHVHYVSQVTLPIIPPKDLIATVAVSNTRPLTKQQMKDKRRFLQHLEDAYSFRFDNMPNVIDWGIGDLHLGLEANDNTPPEMILTEPYTPAGLSALAPHTGSWRRYTCCCDVCDGLAVGACETKGAQYEPWNISRKPTGQFASACVLSALLTTSVSTTDTMRTLINTLIATVQLTGAYKQAKAKSLVNNIFMGGVWAKQRAWKEFGEGKSVAVVVEWLRNVGWGFDSNKKTLSATALRGKVTGWHTAKIKFDKEAVEAAARAAARALRERGE
jgi:hypothetical protein